MPGDEWQRFANLRLLYGYMFTHPGTKLTFMGAEFAQSSEWDFQNSLDWNFLEYKSHSDFQNYFKALNSLYKSTPALYEKGFSNEGFEWISHDDSENCVISYIRKGTSKQDNVIVVCNMTPTIRDNYTIGVPNKGQLIEVFNSDNKIFGGSGVNNNHTINTQKTPWNGKDFSVTIKLPPLGMVVFKLN